MTKIIDDTAIQIRKDWVSKIGAMNGNFAEDSLKLEKELEIEIEKLGTKTLIDHLRLCGNIPESYGHDTSEEKLYSKYTDSLLCFAYKAMGLKSIVLAERADVADVDVFADDYSFVADAKAFRLSRTAKNQKDFKVQAMDRWKHGKPYAMVVCPIYQLPRSASQIYHQATTRNVCIFTYSHLSLLVRYAETVGKKESEKLLFDIFQTVSALNPSKSAVDYWQAVNKTFLSKLNNIETLWKDEKIASTESTDTAKEEHHQLPLSAIHGTGTLSSSDGQRFKIRADSLLASYYPRYYGYYEKAIGIYTHVSDQYSVFSTKVISCGPREALYVLDGLLENNTILKIREHTTDTHGYTEIVFALCYLLGYRFMPRIRDLKDQQLYRVEKNMNYGALRPLLNKTTDPDIIEEQWEPMIRVAQSLMNRTAPAHVIVQRLTSSFPSDRLSKAFTNLGRIIKTEYILRYITDPVLRRTVQLQLNKGEYRHKLARWIFFANQGEFGTGDYEEIMSKASCLSLVSNAILYWNTLKINSIIDSLRQHGENIDDETLQHISLLPFKHVLPNGTYFIEDEQGIF